MVTLNDKSMTTAKIQKLRKKFTFSKSELQFFQRSDNKTFNRILDFGLGLDTPINRNLSRIYQVNPTFHSFIWTPAEVQTVAHLGPSKMKISLLNYVHHALHAILWKKFNIGFYGYPRTVLLMESITCAMDGYFELTKIRNGYIEPSSIFLSKYKDAYKTLNLRTKTFEDFLLQKSKVPFEVFKDSVIQIFTISNYMIQNKEKLQNYNSNAISTLVRMTRNEKMVFTSRYDFGLFCYYIIAECGRKSKTEDLKLSRNVIQTIKRADSMDEFFDYLAEECPLKINS